MITNSSAIPVGQPDIPSPITPPLLPYSLRRNKNQIHFVFIVADVLISTVENWSTAADQKLSADDEDATFVSLPHINSYELVLAF